MTKGNDKSASLHIFIGVGLVALGRRLDDTLASVAFGRDTGDGVVVLAL